MCVCIYSFEDLSWKLTESLVTVWELCWCCFSVAKACPALCYTVGCNTPGSMQFSRQEYWSGLPSSSARVLPRPGVKPMCPALAGRFFTTEPLREVAVAGRQVDKCNRHKTFSENKGNIRLVLNQSLQRCNTAT